MKTDLSNRALESYLSQYYSKRLYPVAFYLRKLSPADLNYYIYNKELLAIINTFK